MRAVLVAVLGVAGQLSATPSPQSVNPSGPPTEHQPSTKVVENDRYYTLSVYQNNAGNSFEDNLINMDSAELKKGEKQLLSWFGLHFVQEMDKSGPPTAFQLQVGWGTCLKVDGLSSTVVSTSHPAWHFCILHLPPSLATCANNDAL